ncbi:MAG TPA: hypothetical protein VFH35_12785, partial [Ramlibacter sp.]|nr:hypothetical protein [Ramlibacter sp.]
MRHAALLLALAALAAHAQPGAPFAPQVVIKSGAPKPITQEGEYTESSLRNGVSATQDQCAAVSHSVWAQTPQGEQACLRYWAEGFEPGKAVPRAVVYFLGDAWSNGTMAPNYPQLTHASLAAAAKARARQLGLPYILVARPGTLGASGDHMERRRPAESRIISAALDVLRSRYGISEFAAAGYSGGGHVVASLLTLRSDIVCAVPTASVTAPRLRWTLHNWTRDATGYSDSYEPTEHLDPARMHPKLRVFVVGDPLDSNAKWPAQTLLAEKLTALKLPAWIVEGEGTGRERHGGLGDLAHRVAGWCAQEM